MSDEQYEAPRVEDREIQTRMRGEPANGVNRVAYEEAVRHLVSSKLTCPFTGVVLDVDSVVLREDATGFPVNVYSPEAWDQITSSPTAARVLYQGAKNAGHQFRTPEERL